jgi:hypothetical protein
VALSDVENGKSKTSVVACADIPAAAGAAP